MNKTDILSGSHLPVLIYLFNHTHGPILEMGMGLNSTPVLHWLCTAHGRRLVSLESDKKWYEMNKNYQNDYHDVVFVEDWDKVNLDYYWSIALIDHRPAIRRRVDAIRLKDNADYVILHDSEPEIKRFYGYDKAYKYFTFRYDYTKFKPNTTVLSNCRSLEFLETLDKK